MKILSEADERFKCTAAALEKVLRSLTQAVEDQSRADQVERDILPLLLAAGHAALEEFFEAAGDGDQGPEVSTKEHPKLKRSLEKHQRRYRSIFGDLTINRYVYCLRPKTKALFKPVDQALGLPEDEVSYVLEDWLANLSVDLAFETATKWLKKTLNIEVSSRTAHRRVEKLGSYAEDFNDQRPSPCLQPDEEILVAQADGKGFPVRTAFEQRVAQGLGIKPPKRPAHKNNYAKSERCYQPGDKTKQRATAGAFYSIASNPRTPKELLDGESAQESSPVNKRLWAELNLIVNHEVSRGAVRVFQSLEQERSKRDPDRSKTLVCLLDGDRHLWELQAAYLPGAVGILDLYHVMTKLWKAAHCFHRESSVEADQWVTKHLRMLLENNVDCVRGLIKRELNKKELSKTKLETLQTVYNYFTTHRDRMKYHDYMKAGYPIGSGVIEGACKHVIGDRMCLTGMRWQFEGAQVMLDMRVAKLNDEWNSFIDYRINSEQARLYQQAA